MPQSTDTEVGSTASTPSVAAHYRARQASLNAQRLAVESTRNRMRLVLFGCAVVAYVLSQHALSHTTPAWSIVVPATIFLGLLPRYFGCGARLTRLERLLLFHDRNLARVDGTQLQSCPTGEEFRSSTHLYERDLDILGPDSLFGLLATVRTGIGQRGLARYLLESGSPEEIHIQSIERQQAVQELTSRAELREEIALLGTTRFEQVPASIFDPWLDETPPAFHPVVRIILVFTSTALVAMLLAGLFHLASWSTLLPNLAAVFALHTAVAMLARRRVKAILGGPKIANQMRMFSDGLALLQQQSFTSSRLIALQQISREPVNAIAALSRIQGQFVIVEQRTKEWFYVLSLLLAAGTHAAISIAKWKRIHAPAMKRWLDAWGEFEALNALANYAFEHPVAIYPQILSCDAPATFEATALLHPLLPVVSAVPNDIRLDPGARFYLISGSNMSGKSTLLRTIGVNAVLAFAGAPIHAAEAGISPLRVGASLAVTDSLAEGKSKFRAEVARLHSILEVSKHAPTLFLIDEIFSGTNSSDRLTAAEGVLVALMANSAIGAISTHDLALTAIAADPTLHGLNIHMASPDPNDPLAFDYLLKPGINTASSALAILRLLGIEI